MKLKRKPQQIIKTQKTEGEEDWDFDFDIYETEEETQKIPESLKELKKPPVTGLRNKFSPWEAVNEQLAEVSLEVSKYSIKLAARTQSLEEIWTYYGLLDEQWELIRHIFGSVINDDMNKLKINCKTLILQAQTKTTIPTKLYTHLLHFRSRIYQLKQVANFSFEVEKSKGGIFAKTRNKIIQ